MRYFSEENKGKTYYIANYIYKELVTLRYSEIYNALINSNKNNYPLNAYEVAITDIYPVYLLIERIDGFLELY